MTARDTLTQARQGNSQAIAVILNHFTRPKEITTDVSVHGAILRIVFSADRLPNKSVMTSFVRRSIEQLDIDVVQAVQVIGQRTGDTPAAWVEEISFEEPHDYLGRFAGEEEVDDRDGDQTEGAIAPSPTTDVHPEPHTSELIQEQGDVHHNGQAPASEHSLATAGVTAANQTWQDLSESPILRRPEAVVLILFVLVLILWQTYQAIIESAAPEGSLNGRELARRLSVSYSTISRRKNREDFCVWSQTLDPDGITWVYTDGVFVPQL